MLFIASKTWPAIPVILEFENRQYVYQQAAIALIDMAIKTLSSAPNKEFSDRLIEVAKIYSTTNPLVLYFLIEAIPSHLEGADRPLEEFERLMLKLTSSDETVSQQRHAEICLLRHALETNMFERPIITGHLTEALKTGNDFAQMLHASILVASDFQNSFDAVVESAKKGHAFAALEYIIEYHKSKNYEVPNAADDLRPILIPLVKCGHPVAILDRALTGKSRSLMYLAAYYENWQACSIIKSDKNYGASDELIKIQTEIGEYENKLAVNRALLLQSTLTWHWRELGFIR